MSENPACRIAPVPHDNSAVVEQMISRYGSNFGRRPPQSDHDTLHSLGTATILVTGTTGNVGSELLALLLASSGIATIYAFNRKSNTSSSRQRQSNMFKTKSFDTRLLDSERVVFLEGDTSAPFWGLSSSMYETLLLSVTHIVHNAWPIGLSRPLSSFEPNFLGLRNLLDFASSSSNASTLRFIFISSLRAAQSWDLNAGLVPEEVLTDNSIAAGGGYGASKFVAERIVANSGLHTTSIRISQICGQKRTGEWSPMQWFPRLVKSSITMGVLPLTSGLASWLHVEAVAQGIVDALFSPTELPSTLNFFHPKPVEFNFLIHHIHSVLYEQVRGGSRPIQLVPYEDWFYVLEQRALQPTPEDLEKIPVIRLMDMFQSYLGTNSDLPEAAETEHWGLHSFSTEKAQKISPAIRNLPKLTTSDVWRWLNYWRRVGYIDYEVWQSRL